MLPIKSQKGFTVVEILLVVSVTVILLAASGPALQTYLGKRSIDNWTLSLQDALRRARAQSVAGLNGTAYGVHVEADNFVLFSGTTFVVDPENEVATLPGTMSLSAITLNGGGADIIFDRNTGETNQGGTVVVSYQSGGSKTVSINELGLVEIAP